MMHAHTHTHKPAYAYPCRAAAQEELTTETLLVELKSSLEWSEGAMATLRHVWKEDGPKLISMPKESLSIGQVNLSSCCIGRLFLRLFDLWLDY